MIRRFSSAAFRASPTRVFNSSVASYHSLILPWIFSRSS